MGLSSMVARISGILCPFILDLSSVWFSLPYFIFGAFSITSGMLILLLPETLGKPMPETIEDAEKIGSKYQATSQVLPITHSPSSAPQV